MAGQFELTAEPRKDIGKGASRRLRRLQNMVPGIVYGAHKEAQSIMIEHNKISKALSHEAFYSHILTLNVAGETQQVVLKGLQRHPCEPRILHFDLLRISATEKINMQVPIHLIGEEIAPGVKNAGGIVSQYFNTLEVECLPAHLPEYIAIDISAMELNDVIHLSEIKCPAGVELVALAHGHDEAVLAIHIPKAVEETEESAAAEGDVTAEGADAGKAAADTAKAEKSDK